MIKKALDLPDTGSLVVMRGDFFWRYTPSRFSLAAAEYALCGEWCSLPMFLVVSVCTIRGH